MKWTNDMYQYLSWLIFGVVYGMTEWVKGENKIINPIIQEIEGRLSHGQILIVQNRAQRLADEYEQNLLHQLNKMYWKELHDDVGYIPRHISFKSDIHEAWMSAVRKRQTVKISYDSTTSGLSERLVNPYLTQIPYGIGYCDKRKKVIQFRFDRIISITHTNHKFEKPKNWREEWEESRRYF